MIKEVLDTYIFKKWISEKHDAWFASDTVIFKRQRIICSGYFQENRYCLLNEQI